MDEGTFGMGNGDLGDSTGILGAGVSLKLLLAAQPPVQLAAAVALCFCCCLALPPEDGENILANFWKGEGGLLTLLLSFCLLAVEFRLIERSFRDNGRSASPADMVVVVVFTLRCPILPVVGVGLMAPDLSFLPNDDPDFLLIE